MQHDLMERTLTDWLKENARMHPDNEAVVAVESGVRYTWKTFDEITTLCARGLMAKGIGAGDKVAIWATNKPEWLILMFATAKIGAILVTVNTNYKQFELEYLLRQSDTKMLVMIPSLKDNNYTEHLLGIVPELKDSKVGELSSAKLPFFKYAVIIGSGEVTPSGFMNFADLYSAAGSVSEKAEQEAESRVSCHDVVNMQYTSGTTGFPKGVMLTHYNVTNNGLFMGDCMAFTPEDRLLIVVPLFHCFGCVLGVETSLTHCTTMVLMERYNPIKEMKMLQNERCTAVHGVPTMFIGMLEHPDFDQFDFSHLRTGIMAGSPCPIKTMRDVTEKMHLPELVITYGQTECSPGMTMSRTDDPLELRVTTVGKLLPHTEGKIVDPETGLTVPNGVPGEICTRGYHIMKGYYKMPEATRQAVDEDGWLHTGDIGSIDDNGYFKITGRLKDMIIRGGENIYPREIEEFLYTHPLVRDVQVVGVPDEKYGEEVLAFIILREDASCTEEEMIEYVQNGLSRFKAPRYVRFVDAFPLTASGKIQKFKLRDMGVKLLHLEKAASIETA